MVKHTLGALILAAAIGSTSASAVGPAAAASGPAHSRGAARPAPSTTDHFLRAVNNGDRAAARRYATRPLVREYLGYHRDGFRFHPAEQCRHRTIPGHPRGWQCGPADMMDRGSVYARVYFYIADRHPQRIAEAGIEESSRPAAPADLTP